MEALMLLLVTPIAWPFIAMRIWNTKPTWQEISLNVLVPVVLVVAIWQLSLHSLTQDFEVWNGYVASKERIHDQYTEYYDCNCTRDDDGYETCETCTREHYTVTWKAETTIGDVTFDHLDSTSRSVYRSDDPIAYTFCKPGEPASLEKSYTNYIKAVPDSLFNNYNPDLDPHLAHVPDYPRVYDLYKINRVINVDTKIQRHTLDTINLGLSEALKELGSSKQVNIIVILTSISDPKYRYSVEGQWIGGKKNDAVVFIGVDDKEIIWADVMTWASNSGNTLFHVKMRDGVKKLGSVDPVTLVPLIVETVDNYFDRPHNEDFEYLKNSIEPPLWLIITAFLVGMLSTFAFTFFFHQNEIDFLNKRRFRNTY